MSNRAAYPNLRLVTDADIPLSRMQRIRQRIARDLHGMTVIALQSVSASVPENERDWAYDLRKGKRNITGGLFRFLDFLHRRGFPIETALLIPQWITAYIYERWNMQPPSRPAIPLTLMRTGEIEKVA